MPFIFFPKTKGTKTWEKVGQRRRQRPKQKKKNFKRGSCSASDLAVNVSRRALAVVARKQHSSHSHVSNSSNWNLTEVPRPSASAPWRRWLLALTLSVSGKCNLTRVCAHLWWFQGFVIFKILQKKKKWNLSTFCFFFKSGSNQWVNWENRKKMLAFLFYFKLS